MRPWTTTECAAVHKELIDAYTLNPPHLRSAPLDHDQCGIHVLQFEHYELDNMTEAFGSWLSRF